MADVTIKIIDANLQPKEGYAVMQPQMADVQNYQTLEPPVNKGLTVDQFDALLTDRLDRPRYYTSTPSGLAY